MIKTACLIIVVLLCAVGLAQAQQEFDPTGGIVNAIPAATYVAPGVSGQRVPVQLHLDVPQLTDKQEAAVREYLNKYAPKLSAQNLAATTNGLRLLIGIRQTHIPLTRRPVEILSDYQLVTQMLEYLRMWIVLPPVEQFYLNPLPELGNVARADRLNLPVGNVRFASTSRELCLPKEQQACNAMLASYGLLPPGGVNGGENSVWVAGETIDLTPLAYAWLLSRIARKCTCEKPHDGECPDGQPGPGPGGGDILHQPTTAPGTPVPGTPATFAGVPPNYSGSGGIASGNPTGPGGIPTINYGSVPGTPGVQTGSPAGPGGPPATPIQ